MGAEWARWGPETWQGKALERGGEGGAVGGVGGGGGHALEPLKNI